MNNRLKLINLATYFCFIAGSLLLVVGVASTSRPFMLSGLILLILSGIIALISGELTAMRKVLDRLDRK